MPTRRRYLRRAGIQALRRPCQDGRRHGPAQQQSELDLAQRRAALDRDRAGLSAARRIPTCCRRSAGRPTRRSPPRRRRSRRRNQPRPDHDHRAGRRRGRRPHRAQGQLVQAGTRLMSVVPTTRSTRRELQGDPDRPHGAGPEGRIDIDAYPGQTSTARSTASRPAPARSSRCCRPRTRPATSPRSCSGCRSRSRSIRQSARPRRLRPGLSVTVDTVDSAERPAGRRDRNSRAVEPEHAPPAMKPVRCGADAARLARGRSAASWAPSWRSWTSRSPTPRSPRSAARSAPRRRRQLDLDRLSDGRDHRHPADRLAGAHLRLRRFLSVNSRCSSASRSCARSPTVWAR